MNGTPAPAGCRSPFRKRKKSDAEISGMWEREREELQVVLWVGDGS